MDRVKVLVVAGQNKGKTTIAHIIKEALEAQGFASVSLKDLPASVEAKQPIQLRVEATKKRPVIIEVVTSDEVMVSNVGAATNVSTRL